MDDKNHVLSYEQVVESLRERTKGWGEQVRFARARGVNPCQVTTMLGGRPMAGARFMEKLGYLRVVCDADGNVVSNDDVRAALQDLVAANKGNQTKTAQKLGYAQPSICAVLRPGCHISEGMVVALGFSIGYIEMEVLNASL